VVYVRRRTSAWYSIPVRKQERLEEGKKGNKKRRRKEEKEEKEGGVIQSCWSVYKQNCCVVV
jgi:hypothetical protein